MKNIIFHIDINSAFLSFSAIEKLNQGETLDLRTIPSIIGGDSSKRHGIVLAKSIPAKAFGIQTGEPVRDAFKKCPGLTIVSPDHTLYHSMSKSFVNFLKNICPDVEQVSIDECYMDYTPISHLYDSPIAAATQIKDRIRDTFGFTVNIGISDRKVLAKMASDFKKPDLVHTLFQSEIKSKMWPLPVSDLFMCGASSVNVLHNLSIITIGDLAVYDTDVIKSHLKSHGQLLWQFANGIDDSIVTTKRECVKGIGNSTTLAQDAVTIDEIKPKLLALSESVSTRLRCAGQRASMISVEIKYSTFQSVSHQCTLYIPTDTCNEIYQTACNLVNEIWNGSPVRLLGIRSSKLQEVTAPTQMSIFDLPCNSVSSTSIQTTTQNAVHKQVQLESALDNIRKKYGEDAITRGTLLHPPK